MKIWTGVLNELDSSHKNGNAKKIAKIQRSRSDPADSPILRTGLRVEEPATLMYVVLNLESSLASMSVP